MSIATLERIAAAATSDAAAQSTELSRGVIALLPWAAQLPAEDFTLMLEELRTAALSRAAQGDASLVRLLDEWQATAEAYQDRGFMDHLARTDRKYVNWE